MAKVKDKQAAVKVLTGGRHRRQRITGYSSFGLSVFLSSGLSVFLTNDYSYLYRMVYLTRVEHFNAAHKLYNPAWSREKNEAVFGPCANENWHGHNYELLVTIKGEPDSDTGFIIDAKHLSRLIKEHVLDKVDHRNLNVDVAFMQGKMCSTENFVIEIWKQLEPHINGGQLHQLRLYETPRIFVDYYGS